MFRAAEKALKKPNINAIKVPNTAIWIVTTAEDNAGPNVSGDGGHHFDRKSARLCQFKVDKTWT